MGREGLKRSKGTKRSSVYGSFAAVRTLTIEVCRACLGRVTGLKGVVMMVGDVMTWIWGRPGGFAPAWIG